MAVSDGGASFVQLAHSLRSPKVGGDNELVNGR